MAVCRFVRIQAGDRIVKVYRRDVLSFRYRSLVAFDLARAAVMLPSSKEYVCLTCGRRFRGVHGLLTHISLRHFTNRRLDVNRLEARPVSVNGFLRVLRRQRPYVLLFSSELVVVSDPRDLIEYVYRRLLEAYSSYVCVLVAAAATLLLPTIEPSAAEKALEDLLRQIRPIAALALKHADETYLETLPVLVAGESKS